MRVSQEYADEWVTHLIRTGGTEQTVTPTEELVHAESEYTRLGERKRNWKPKGIRKLSCNNCQRETEYLFDGFKEPAQMAAAELYYYQGKPATRDQVRAMCVPFQSERARVCLRCRPPSNLEIQELLHGQ